MTLSTLVLPTLCKKCPYSEFFWFVFSRIRSKYGEIQSIQSECGKIRTKKTPNTDNFYAVLVIDLISLMHYF